MYANQYNLTEHHDALTALGWTDCEQSMMRASARIKAVETGQSVTDFRVSRLGFLNRRRVSLA